MKSVNLDIQDISGNRLEPGDTVVTVNGQTTGRVCEMTLEDDTGFVCLRPVHQTFGQGVWYAADQVFWVARPNAAGKKSESKPGAGAGGTGGGRTKPASKK